ncbi:hypothetical protein Tco_0553055 [Tanacetum coccineum]
MGGSYYSFPCSILSTGKDFQIFYDHVNPATRRTIDQSAGGKLRDRNAKESWALIEDIAFYDNKSWNDPKGFTKPVKAVSLPQDVPSTSDRRLIKLENKVQRLMEAHIAPMQPTQVNKITSSCDMCSGPHDTQYCMKDPEQALVEYAASRTNEEGDPRRNDEERKIEWLDVEEPLDLVDTCEESIYESLIKEMPKCSLNYDFRIKKGDPRNLKIPCMIGHKFTTNAYIDVDLPVNIMSLAYYNSIRKNGYEYKGRNFVGLGRDMHVFVGNMSYVIDFTILENIETNIDPSLSHVVFGRPFVEIACLAINRKHSEDDYDRGCRKPSDLEDGFYRDTIKLGPEYVTGIADVIFDEKKLGSS